MENPFSIYFGTILAGKNETIRIDDVIPCMGGDGYCDITITYLDKNGQKCGFDVFTPYEIMTLAAKAEKIVYPNGDEFTRE